MKFSKKAVIALSCAVAGACLFAQTQTTDKNTSNSSDKKSETSVENEYLNDADGTVILTLANSDEYDNKLVAMQYLQNAVDNGNTSDEVVAALDQLAGEGISTQNRKNGRLVNNYPDIRRQACILMAKIPTEHSKNSLMQIAIAENEPMVIAAAVNSLGEIGMNNNDEVVNAIAFANRRNQILNPTSSLAAEVIDCYAKLANSTENKKSVIDSLTQI